MHEARDITLISQLIQAWSLFRDQGLWTKLANTFTPGGQIAVSWYSGGIDGFIERCRATHKAESPRSKHLLGAPFVRAEGDRAIAETNVQILGRMTLARVAVDNTSHARFLDKLHSAAEGWRIVSRVAIYEKDRLDPVIPSPGFTRLMNETDLSDIPEPYRFLGFRLRQMGRELRAGTITDGSKEALLLLEGAEEWLAGG